MGIEGENGTRPHIYKVHSAGDGAGTKHSCLKSTYELRVTGYKRFSPLYPILGNLISQHRKDQLAEVMTLINAREERLKTSNDRGKFILDELKRGQTISQVAKIANRSPRYLYEWLYRRGLSVSKVRAHEE